MTKYEPALSNIFAALSDPTRRAILQRLAAGPASLGDLAAPTGFALPTVLRHVEVLRRAGLIDTEKRARQRICRARPAALAAARGWMGQTLQAMQAQTNRLEAYLETLHRSDHDL